MVTAKEGESACSDIEAWGNRVARRLDPQVAIEGYYDAESSTYVLRVYKDSRVLLFRLSQAQVRAAGREAECQRTLERKVKDLWNLI
jgi:hypothetical protein